ncbi:Uma2 family endonuclease [Aquisphaera insulae]|uniref:Uma2 family endonuclease n=1 Tax=Aquisphaera insulae TaxID=2712864 RepID=UPI0013E9C8ED|nr:Uma2 family endonuclease [Aquisphaera insulae]
MSPSIPPLSPTWIKYPDSDGKPMADNTIQYEWIVTIKGNLDELDLDGQDVFVAGDLFWYPVEGDPNTRAAPDVMVAIGRPKGHRYSYLQWDEGGIPPQVVFEILSPGNRAGEMTRKRRFYERFGVEEYYVYDPARDRLEVWIREGDRLAEQSAETGWVSPRLGIRFDTQASPLIIRRPNGTPFESFHESQAGKEEAIRERDAIAEQRDAIAEQRDAAIELARDEAEKRRRLEARLRELGIEP